MTADREAAIREALLDTSNALVPGTMTEAAHDALGHLDALLAELAAAREDAESWKRLAYHYQHLLGERGLL